MYVLLHVTCCSKPGLRLEANFKIFPLNQMNQVHFVLFLFNIILVSTSKSSKKFFPSWFEHKPCIYFFLLACMPHAAPISSFLIRSLLQNLERITNHKVSFFIVVPCILITLKFLSPTNALLYYTYKMLKCTVKISHDCCYIFRSIWTIIREPMPNVAKVTILWRYSVKIRR